MTRTHDLLTQRYGGARPGNAYEELNPVLESLLSHRSVRAFRRDPLEPGTLELLVAAAQSAPSSSNLQVWSVISVEDEARKDRIAEHAGGQQHIREAPLFLAWLADTSRLQDIGKLEGIPSDGLNYLDTFLMGAIDAALAAQNALVAAESLGLGTVYIGALRNRPEAVKRELGLPPHVFPLFGLCVGRPDAARPSAVKPRLAQRAVLFREQYDSSERERTIADYDAIMESFYKSQGLDNPRWSKHSAERVRGPESLRGRDRLRQALHTFGFQLK